MKYFSYFPYPFRWLENHLALLLCLLGLSAQAQPTWSDSQQDRTITLPVKWNYDGYTFTNDLTFNRADYLYYRGLSKSQPYSAYCIEHSSHPYLQQLAKVLDADAKKLGYTGRKVAEYLTAFVQQLPYVPDPQNGGHDWPKYGIETLLEGGDCEDHSSLLCALLNTFGFDAILIEVPGHMAVGLSYPGCSGSYYNYNGKRYYYVETAGCCWAIGTIPNDYSQASAKLISVNRPSQYRRSEKYAYTPPIKRKDDNEMYTDNYGESGNNYSNRNVSVSSTVTINGVTYRLKGSRSTSIVINNGNVSITYK